MNIDFHSRKNILFLAVGVVLIAAVLVSFWSFYLRHTDLYVSLFQGEASNVCSSYSDLTSCLENYACDWVGNSCIPVGGGTPTPPPTPTSSAGGSCINTETQKAEQACNQITTVNQCNASTNPPCTWNPIDKACDFFDNLPESKAYLQNKCPTSGETPPPTQAPTSPPGGGGVVKDPVVSCPLKASDGKIFNFPDPYHNYVLANKTQAIATKGPYNFSLAAGNYKVTLVGFDDHSRNGGQGQNKEQYYVMLKDGSSTVAQSGASADIPDNKDYSTKVVNQNLALTKATNRITAFHNAYKASGPQSVTPVCAAFLALSGPPTPTSTPTATPTNTPTSTPTATPIGDPTPTPTPTATPGTPAINVNKSANPMTLLAGGGSVTYGYVVTNTGNVTLTNIALSDDRCSTVTQTGGDTNSNGQLEVSEAWAYTCAKNLTVTTTNMATVEGFSGSTKVSDTDQETVTVGGQAILSLIVEKLGQNLTKQETSPRSRVDANPGDLLRFTIYISSESTERLTNIVVRDVLPAEVIYEPGSTQVGGVARADGIAGSGITIPTLDQDAEVQITFRGRVAPGSRFATGTTILVNAAYARANGVAEKDSKLPIYVAKNIIVPISEVQTGVDGATLTLLISTVMTSLYYVGRSGLGFLKAQVGVASVEFPKKAVVTLGTLLLLLAGSLGLSSRLKNSNITAIEIRNPIVHTSDESYFALIANRLKLRGK